MNLKVVLDKSNLKTNATIMRFKRELTCLKATIETLKFNVTRFNDSVYEVERNLHYHGAVATDLIIILSEAYLIVPVQKFNMYIKAKKNAYEDGTDIKAHSLMKDANHKYIGLKRNDEWNIESSEDDILALKAEVQKMCKSMSTNRNKGGKRFAKKDKGKKKRKDSDNMEIPLPQG